MAEEKIMGTPDSIKVPCPNCGKIEYFQSKGGEKLMANYTLKNAPKDVLSNINRHSPYKCKCGTWFYVNEDSRKAEIWGVNSFYDHWRQSY
jgi:predicted RNA-binding Zn-ribbon protein involved in translation (DUF1610 family)